MKILKNWKKEVEEDTRRAVCSWTCKTNVMKMTMLPKATHKIQMQLNPPMIFSTELKIIKFIWKNKRLQRAKPILKRKQQIQQYVTSDYITES